MENTIKKGRKPKDTIVRNSRMTIKFSEKEIEEINKLSKYLQIPKTVVARNLTLYGLEEAKGFKRLGLLEIVKKLIKTSEWLNKFKNLKNQ